MEDKNLLLKPKIDVVFHALFREENKRLTESLITDILGEKVKIKTTNKDRHLNIKDPNQKFGIMDLATELEDGTNCNIEIQLKEHDYENERFLYYWANSYSRQLMRGNEYNSLHKTISIIILDHEIKELEGIEKLGMKWQIRDEESGKRILTDQLEIVIIEIPKAIRQYKINDKNRISQWMMFLDNPNNREVKKIMDENEDIKKAIEELNAMSEDDELRWMAELRVKAIRDEHAAISLATKRGIEQGIEQGIVQGEKKKQMEIAKNMVQKNMNIEDIIEVTGLTEEEIKQIII